MQVLVGSKLETLGTEHIVACRHTIQLKLLKEGSQNMKQKHDVNMLFHCNYATASSIIT